MSAAEWSGRRDGDTCEWQGKRWQWWAGEWHLHGESEGTDPSKVWGWPLNQKKPLPCPYLPPYPLPYPPCLPFHLTREKSGNIFPDSPGGRGGRARGDWGEDGRGGGEGGRAGGRPGGGRASVRFKGRPQTKAESVSDSSDDDDEEEDSEEELEWGKWQPQPKVLKGVPGALGMPLPQREASVPGGPSGSPGPSCFLDKSPLPMCRRRRRPVSFKDPGFSRTGEEHLSKKQGSPGGPLGPPPE